MLLDYNTVSVGRESVRKKCLMILICRILLMELQSIGNNKDLTSFDPCYYSWEAHMSILNLLPNPIKEEYLLSGHLEPTNESYAIAKIAVIKMCDAYNRQYGTNFISIMPTNLCGPNDNFVLEASRVLPVLISKLYEAKINNTPQVEI